MLNKKAGISISIFAVILLAGCSPSDLGLMVDCYPELPSPKIVVTGAEPYDDKNSRYHLDVLNYSEFPDKLFAVSPHLPSCASRTWVSIFDGDGKMMYGFCALEFAKDLNAIWVGASTESPPSHVYIVLNDRKCGIKYKSNLASTSF